MRHRRRIQQVFFWCVLLVFAASALELLGYLTLRYALGVPYVQARRALLGAGSVERDSVPQNVIGQAYLNYIPAPNYRSPYGDNPELLHNAHGYRGTLVPVERRPNTLRVLCLGASTTYGSSVFRSGFTYPAHLERWLEQHLQGVYEDVEVINAGVHFATTAELLTHYQFKFHYYRPDLVVINTGGNDAVPRTRPYYQPDYSHFRESFVGVRPLPGHVRWLAHSHLASAFILECFHHDEMHGNPFQRLETGPPPAPWFSGDATPAVPPEFDAFRHNLEALLTLLAADSARVVLVPFRPAPRNEYTPEILAAMAEHERTLKALAQQYGAVLAPFPASVISPENWTDNCHLNEAGCAEKAAHIGPCVIQSLGGPPP